MNTPVTCFTALISIAEEEQVCSLSVIVGNVRCQGIIDMKNLCIVWRARELPT